MEFYHNPRCRKSREALALLEGKGVEPDIRLYLEEVPSEAEIEALLNKLGKEPEEIVRKSEAAYKEHYKGKSLNRKQWIKALASHPKLIERPILIKGKKAVVGRPPENVLTLI